MIKDFKDLLVWQKGMDLVCEIYRLTKLLPKEEIYGLCNQMQRAAVSVPSNIAEGQSRTSTKEFVQFLSIAKASNAELETQLLICNRLEFLSMPQTQVALCLCKEIGKMLNSLMSSLTV